MEPFLGQIMLCPYTFAPKGWADCAGQLLAVRQFTALFSLLGTNYGGDGISTFGLPDLRGRVPVSQGQRPGGSQYAMGQAAGVPSVTLSTATMAPHTHVLNAVPGPATTASVAGASFAKLHPLRSGGLYGPMPSPPTPVSLSPVAVQPSGGNAAHNNMQPFLVLRYVIALSGVFPQRP